MGIWLNEQYYQLSAPSGDNMPKHVGSGIFIAHSKAWPIHRPVLAGSVRQTWNRVWVRLAGIASAGRESKKSCWQKSRPTRG
jgi:hypothetical protein